MQFYSDEQYDEFQRDLAGDGHSNEYQRCFAQSQVERPLRDDRPIAITLSRAGRVVVCAEYEVCCPVTDALIGRDWVVLKHFASQSEAHGYLGDAGNEPDEPFIFTVPIAPPVPPVIHIDEDDIPF